MWFGYIDDKSEIIYRIIQTEYESSHGLGWVRVGLRPSLVLL